SRSRPDTEEANRGSSPPQSPPRPGRPSARPANRGRLPPGNRARSRTRRGPGAAAHAVPVDRSLHAQPISRVVASRHPGFQSCALVQANAGWQDYALSDGSDLVPVDGLVCPSLALGGLGMPGFTAYVGLLDIGQPRAGETVVVAAATGAVGAVAGQLARLHGARVVGIAGGADKCRHAVEVLGFDACIDHRAP